MYELIRINIYITKTGGASKFDFMPMALKQEKLTSMLIINIL